jgi:DNA-binding response OmpR family regulator
VTTVLVIEDDPAILRGLADNLRYEGYQVLQAPDAETGRQLHLSGKPDLIVLDLMLPRTSGLEFCRRLRASADHTPILIVTARSEEADRVLGLDVGADDYVTKPFSVRELMARVRALLRRTQEASRLPTRLTFDDVELDFRSYTARRQGHAIEMTRKEFATLRLLAARAGSVVTRDELLNEVWGYESSPVSRTVDNHIASLRAKLEAVPSRPRRIQTVHGVGYKFVR